VTGPQQAQTSVERLTPDALVKRMRFGKMAVTCVIDHFAAPTYSRSPFWPTNQSWRSWKRALNDVNDP